MTEAHHQAPSLARAFHTAARILFLAAAIATASCGGGGGASVPSSSTPLPTASPVEVSLYADQAVLAAGDSVTLTWAAAHAASCVASGGWTGSRATSGSAAVGPLNAATTFTLQCVDSAGTTGGGGTVSVDVAGAQPPSPTTSMVYSDSGLTSLSYFKLDISTNAVVWDAMHSRLQALTSASSLNYPSSIVSIDPDNGQVTAHRALASEGHVLALSNDGGYLYAAGLGAYGFGGDIQRVHASDLSLDLQFSVGSADLLIQQIAVSPVAPRTIAVVAMNLAPLQSRAGVLLVDDSVPRANSIHGDIPNGPDSYIYVSVAGVSWSPDGTTIYAPPFTQGGFLDLAVSPNGLSIAQARPWTGGSNGRLAGTRFYQDDGRVLDLFGPIEQVGRFPDYGNDYSHVEALSVGKTFSLERHTPGHIFDGDTINAFNPITFTTIDRITFNGAAMFDGARLVPWGTDGIAITGAQSMLIAHGGFAASGGIPPSPTSLPVISSGTINGSGGALSYSVLDIGARDLVTDTCHNMYIAMSGVSAYLPNSILRYDTVAGAIAGMVNVGSEPITLAVSDDCSTLYAGLRHSNSITRVHAPDLSVEASIPIGGNTTHAAFAFARSISVAPGSPRTIAAARGMGIPYTLCDGADLGLTVYDGIVPRANAFDPGVYGVKSVVWGVDAGTLYGEDAEGTKSFRVDATGLHDPLLLMPYSQSGLYLYDLGRNLYFDAPRRRLFDSFGHVFDTAAGKSLGPIAANVAIDADCGSPTAGRVTDATTGKVFFVSENVVTAYDAISFAQVGQANLPFNTMNLLGSYPIRVVRPSSDSLAFVTSTGHLVILKGAMLGP